MEKVIDYFFTPISGYAYLGHQALQDVVQGTEAAIRYCPIDILKVFNASETTPPAKQSTARKTYRQEDMCRLAQKHQLPLNKNPAFWPTDGTLASKAILVSGRLQLDQSQVTSLVMQAVWALDLNIADASTLQELLESNNLPGQKIIDGCEDSSVQSEFDDITQAAIETGVFGSPTYVYNNERYWGQDRLKLLQERL